VEQFHRLCEAVPEQRLELIDGEVLQVIAKGTRHTAVVHRLIAAIQTALAKDLSLPLQLRVKSPLDLGRPRNRNPIWLWQAVARTIAGRPTPPPPTPFW
jgi:hypothetical protein